MSLTTRFQTGDSRDLLSVYISPGEFVTVWPQVLHVQGEDGWTGATKIPAVTPKPVLSRNIISEWMNERIFSFFFSGPHLEVPKLGVKSELQLRPTPQPQQHQIRAVFVTYPEVCGNTRSLTHWTRSGIKPTSSRMPCHVRNSLSHHGNSWTQEFLLFFWDTNQAIHPQVIVFDLWSWTWFSIALHTEWGYTHSSVGFWISIFKAVGYYPGLR